MKKIIITMILMLNLIPILDREGITLWPAHTAYGQNQGEEEGDDEECEEEIIKIILSEWHECYDIYTVVTETYNCETGAQISIDSYDYTEYKECDIGGDDEEMDCAGVIGGTAYEADCGCIGGTTGIMDCEEEMDCNGDPGGSAYFDDCGCIGGNTGISECPPEEEPDYPEDPGIDIEAEVSNDITDNCLKSVVNNFMNGNILNPFVNILQSSFGASSGINLRFKQYSDSSTTDIDGTTNGGNQYNFDINLNLAALDFSSNENITATIYHELIHAYLNTQGIVKSQQHDIIANEWRDEISEQLRLDFPSLSITDADALAWGGLGTSTLWLQMLESDANNNTGITGEISQRIKNHKNLNNENKGKYGTHCN